MQAREELSTVRRRASIHDVAHAAGLSSGTVSRVLNGHPDVSPAARARVEQAVAQLDYQPNPVGRALSRKRTAAIGILMPDMVHHLFMLEAEGIEAVASRHGYAVMVGNSQRNLTKELRFGDLMAQFSVSGLILMGGSRRGDRDIARRVGGIPTVVIGRRASGGLFPAATVDHYAAATLAVEHLLRLGHRRIAAVRGDPDSEAGAERQRGYVEALQRRDIEPDPAMVAGHDFGLTDGIAATRQLLSVTPRPTAIFFPSDELAFGGLSVIKEHGLRAPDDISVISINGTPFVAMTDPPLTSVQVPARELGMMAMQLLIDLIEHDRPVHDVVLGVELVERGSVGPPPQEVRHSTGSPRPS